ncbi:MAG: hypothetical protein COA58_11465 [Bacteroidetes bacterium]|nr:MAG: hypothetical protein COA58_11465 [Bacteroidota bacterium]
MHIFESDYRTSLGLNMIKTKQTIKTPFNEEFCTQLEYQICKELEKSDDQELRGFWCDGVSCLPTEIQLTKKHVNDNRKIETKAWIGKDGQDVYLTIIYFGKKALKRYAKDKDLTDSIPPLNSEQEWIEIDIENKSIELRLS